MLEKLKNEGSLTHGLRSSTTMSDSVMLTLDVHVPTRVTTGRQLLAYAPKSGREGSL